MIEYSTLVLGVALVSGFFMACGIGANDVANTMGTSVGAKVLSIRQALVIAAIFEAAGAFLASGQVTETIRSRIIDVHLLNSSPELFIYGMLAALLSAGVWLAIATYFGWPVSTTHSIIGAVIGFGAVGLGVHAVQWGVVVNIFLSWIITPILAGILAYFLFKSIYWLILNKETPLKEARRFLPLYVFFVAFIMSSVTLIKGLEHLHLAFATNHGVLLSLLISVFFMLASQLLLKRVMHDDHVSGESISTHIERGFGILAVFTACSLGFAHGSNDVANAIGPLGAIFDVINNGNSIASSAPLPAWIPLFGAVGIVVGLALYGHRVIATIGSNITLLTPSRAFAAQLSTAATVVIASGLGLPISTTQTLVGAVLGVGFAGGINALNLNVIRNIFMSWVITLPAGAVMAIGFFFLFKALFA
jgi:PiT family inorganic phosphate transporter